MKAILRSFFLLIAVLPSLLCSQEGNPDLSFGTGGEVVLDIFGTSDLPYSVIQQNNGNLIVAGGTEINGDLYPVLVSFLPNGSIDTSFGNNGIVWTDYNVSFANYVNVLVQADSKILTTGTFYIAGEYSTLLTRFLPNGEIDMSFGVDGILEPFPDYGGLVNTIVQDDQSLIMTATIVESGMNLIAIKKFLTDGMLDMSFGNNGVVTTFISNEANYPLKIIQLEDESIVLLVRIGSQSQQPEHLLIKYAADGTLDTSYGNNGMVSITLQPDFFATDIASNLEGKVYVSSALYDWMNEQSETRLQRYLINGDFDNDFGDNGIANPNRLDFAASKIFVQENQRILLHGEFSTNYFEGGGSTGLVRFYDNGTLDPGFNLVPLNFEFYVNSMTVQQDGKIVSVGNTPWYNGQEDFVLERYNNNPLGVSEYSIEDIVLYPNPSEGIFILETTTFLNERSFQITDVLGKVIKTGTLASNQTTVDISTVQAGIYFLNINGSTFRLLKN